MILHDRYDGREAPFDGDRELLSRHLPADARIVSARATVTPVDLTDGREPFVETIRFQGNTGDWGATKARLAQADSIPGFVEVDFHARRTLAGVQGSDIDEAELQVDLGGAFVVVGANGAVGIPDSSFLLSGNSAPLPGLTVTRFRLTGDGTPDVTSVRVRSLPSNVTLALRGRPSFWFHVGELITPQTTTDFVTVLAAYLPEAEIRDGYYLLPFVLHADGISRLEVVLEIEYVRTASVLPNGLAEATLPFAFGSLPASSTALALSLPGNAALARGGSVGRALGTFEGTRVAFGPTGEIEAERSATVTPAVSLAQPVELSGTVETVAVDLLLGAVQREARLKIDLLEDLDGKPGGRSLWPAAVPFAITPETVPGGTAWISVALPQPFQIKAGTPGWLVLQSLDGEADWKILPAEAASPGLHRTDDGGLSWRKAVVGDPQAALLRLRDQPKDFRMPIELQVGTGDKARCVSLRRLDPQRRVEIPFDLPEIEDAFDKALAEAAPIGCPRGEHLADGSFEQWVKVGDRLGEAQVLKTTDKLSVSDFVAVSPNGRRAWILTDDDAKLHAVDLGCGRVEELLVLEAPAVAFAVHPDGTRAYAANEAGLRVIDLENRRLVGAPLAFSPGPISLAVSPDGGLLYLGFAMNQSDAIQSLDTARLEEAARRGEKQLSKNLISASANLGDNWNPVALVPSRDGSRLWALLRGNGASEILALETPGLGILHATSVSLGAGAFDLALTPDGRRGFVAGGEDLHVIDLARRTEIGKIHGAALSVTVTPQGDRILATYAQMVGLYAIPIGAPVPAEWVVISGRVARDCLGDPARPVAVLGGLGDEAVPADSIVAQVVPIAPKCDYELSFDGIAIGEGAVAEVLWRGEGCTPAGSVSLPIEPANDARLLESSSLHPHRLRLDPPAGATQAEIRFRVPVGGAAVTAASFKAIDAVLGAGDLRPGMAGVADPWTQTPAAVPGFTRLPAGSSGTRLRNAGAREVVLGQTVPVTAGSAFTLEVQGRSRGPLRPVAAAALRWLAGDAPLSAPPITLEIPPGSFDGLAAAGTVPTGADRAELRVTIPPGITLDVERIELRFPGFVTVPVNFIAEAPGELALLDWRIAWNERDLPPPPVPATGLCPPTPPAPSVFGPSSSKGADGCDPCDPEKGAALPITRVNDIGRSRARVLHANGLGSLEAIATSDVKTLSGLLRGVTEESAARIIVSARELLRNPG